MTGFVIGLILAVAAPIALVLGMHGVRKKRSTPLTESGQSHAKYQHGFALVRIDLPLDAEFPEQGMAVKKVLFDEKEANDEAERLNALNGAKGCRYFVSITRIVPPRSS